MYSRRGDTFRLSINTARKKIVFEIAILLLAISYAGVAAAHFAAAELSTQTTLSRLQWASRLDPWSGKYQDILGRYELLAANRADLAIPFFRRAIGLNPYSSRYWLDLASAEYLEEDNDTASSGVQQAVLVNPKTPDALWEAANIYIVLGKPEQALHIFSSILAGDPTLRNRSLEYCWRLNPDAGFLLRETVPPDAVADFLEFLIARNEPTAAVKAWDRIIQSQEPLDRQHVFNYMQFLIDRRDFAQAKSTWSQSAAVAGLEQYQPSATNVIVNGDFRSAVLNAGFDWRYEKKTGVSLSLDPSHIRSGVRSLKIAFDSPGIDDAGIYQLVPVDSNSQYEFSVNFRSEDLRGAGGPRFVVEDFADRATLYSSDDLRSDALWSRTQAIFSTGPETQLVLLRIARVPPDNAIRGRLWIDSVTLKPVHTLAEAIR
jgi:tetratricopeptide (TPR) repeat protein